MMATANTMQFSENIAILFAAHKVKRYLQ